MAWKFDLSNNSSFVSYKVWISCPVKILVTKGWKPCGTVGGFQAIAEAPSDQQSAGAGWSRAHTVRF